MHKLIWNTELGRLKSKICLNNVIIMSWFWKSKFTRLKYWTREAAQKRSPVCPPSALWRWKCSPPLFLSHNRLINDALSRLTRRIPMSTSCFLTKLWKPFWVSSHLRAHWPHTDRNTAPRFNSPHANPPIYWAHDMWLMHLS